MNYFKSFDDKKIAYKVWDNITSPIGLIQILHGVNGHIDRYDEFARYMNAKGFIVFGSNHRGHAFTETYKEMGITDSNFWSNTLEDNRILSKLIKEKYNLPLFIMGHSLGSFLTEDLIKTNSNDYKGIVLSGSIYLGGLKIKVGKIFANMRCIVSDDFKRATFIDKIAFSDLNKDFYDSKYPNRWLTRDIQKQKEFFEDKYFASYIMSNGFHKSFLNACDKINKIKNMKNIRKDLPIYIIAGTKDRINNNTLLTKKLYDLYKNKLEMPNVKLKLYEGARHEMLNEINRQEVFKEISDYYKNLME